MKTQKELVIVVRDKDGAIVNIVSKSGPDVQIYKTERVGFDDIADLFNDMIKTEPVK